MTDGALYTYDDTAALWRSLDVCSTASLERTLEHFDILFAYHSGRIENDAITYADTREIFLNGQVTGFTGDPRALFEQRNQKRCTAYLKPRVIAKDKLSVGLVKEIHRLLTEGTYDERRYIENGERPGAFKRHDYIIGVHEVGLPPEQVETAVADLLDEVNAYEGERILKAAAYFHARFEFIHPFADGNGRTGRTLLNYFLMTRNMPPLIVFDDQKSDYYAALERYDAYEDIEALTAFLDAQTVKTWYSSLDRRSGIYPERHNTLNDL